jgi:hypothetical protein
VIGREIESPLANLRGGLVLGDEKLWRTAQAALGRKSRRDVDGMQWLRRAGREHGSQAGAPARVAAMAADEKDKRTGIWMRVVLGGERMTDLARALGYSDGGGVLRVVQRLEARAQKDHTLAVKLNRLRREWLQ